MKDQLKKQLDIILEELKEFHKFADLMSDKPEGTLTRLHAAAHQVSMLLEATEIKDVKKDDSTAVQRPLFHQDFLVKIRPCGAEYEDKTFLGIYIGDVALSTSWKKKKDGNVEVGFCSHNPAIFVPALNKIIYGCESWWGEIKNPEDLTDITDKDIDSVWYVQALKAMAMKDRAKTDEPT